MLYLYIDHLQPGLISILHSEADKLEKFLEVRKMKVVKRLCYARHSLKAGANNTIGSKGIAYAQEKAPYGYSPEGFYTDLFYGPLYRTLQTLVAIVAAVGCEPGTRVHAPIDEIGTDELFAAMVNDQFKQAVKNGASNITALHSAGHSAEQLSEWFKQAADGVKKMFDLIPEGDYGLAIGHDPIISMAARELGYPAQSLKEMEWLNFVLYEDGTIHVEDPRE